MKLSELRRFALSLPEVTEEPHHSYLSFRVRGKIFVTVPPDGEYIHLFVDDTSREQALALYSEFVDKLLWGGKVRGVRVRIGHASAAAVRELVRSAWTSKAPNSLTADVPR